MLTWKCASRHHGVHFFIIKTSKNGLRPSVFYTFRLRNALRATTVCNCSSLISAPAALASLLFGPPEPQIIGKHSASRLFYLFAHLHLLSSDSFSSLIFFLLLFSSLTLPTSAFPSLHVVISLTSKLPWIIINNHFPLVDCDLKVLRCTVYHGILFSDKNIFRRIAGKAYHDAYFI